LELVEVDRDDDFFPKSTDLIHFAGDFPIGAYSAARRGFRDCKRIAHQCTDLHEDQISPAQPQQETQEAAKAPFVATSPTSNLAEDFKKTQRRRKMEKKEEASKDRGANTNKCSTKEPKSTVQSIQTVAEVRETLFPTPLKQHRSRRRRRPEDARRI
jgi:hypothetical protein